MSETTTTRKVIECGLEYTVVTYDNGNTGWYLGNEFHREEGPAIEYHDGGRVWWLNNRLVYAEYEDNTANFDISDKMRMSIIKYKLSRA